MSLTCLSCRNEIGQECLHPVAACPECGGELVGEQGAWLEWTGPEGDQTVLLGGAQVTVGRRSQNDVTVKDHKVSKNHASIHREGHLYYVRDWCSANGTFVNGQRVAEKHLENGDLIIVGGTEIRFHSGGAPGRGGGITIVPQPDSDDGVQACLVCEPGDFLPVRQIDDIEEIRSDYERLRIAYQFNRYMGSEQNERALTENILKFAFELLPADRGAILLREEDGAPLTRTVTHRRGSQAGEIVIPDSILRRAVKERTAVLSGDASTDLRFKTSESVLSENIRSAMCVPLVGQREVLGAVHLDTFEETGAFSVKDLQLLSMVGSLSAAFIERLRLQKRLAREATARERLSRFLAPEVLQEVVERGMDLESEGRTGKVTVLFCDIRGFSSVAEAMDPTQLVRMLNAFFERMVEVVFRHGGVLDKFIGDALMAVWGAPIQRDNDAVRAVAAGQEILEAVGLFNQSSRGQGWPELRVGVGINTGEAVIGAVGSSRRMEYTVMGDAVNVAARICNQARGGQMLITEESLADYYQAAENKPQVRDLPPANVRGRKNPVRVFELLET